MRLLKHVILFFSLFALLPPLSAEAQQKPPLEKPLSDKIENKNKMKKAGKAKKKSKFANTDLYQWKDAKINWSVYSFTEHSYFEFENGALSKLVWNNMLMIGYGSHINFPLKTGYHMQLNVEGATNYTGYSTDDDLRNSLIVISLGGVQSTYAYASVTTGKSKSMGKIKNSWLAGVAFSNHDLRMLEHKQMRNYKESCYCFPSLPGVTQDYNIFLLGPEFQTDFSYQFKDTLFALIFKSAVSIHLAVADWPYRSDFVHPVSFTVTGFAFSFELRLHSQTFFTKNFSMHMDLKMATLYTPPLLIVFPSVKRNGKTIKNKTDLTKYSWGLRSGIEIGMDFHF